MNPNEVISGNPTK